jgi:hypothetical protein
MTECHGSLHSSGLGIMNEAMRRLTRRLRNPVQRAIPGLVVATGPVGSGHSQKSVILYKPGVNPPDALLTDILGMVHYWTPMRYDAATTVQAQPIQRGHFNNPGQYNHAEVNLGASQRGWGTLLYNITARIAKAETGADYLVPSHQRSDEAKAFWKRMTGGTERLMPLTDEQFAQRFGSPGDVTFANLTPEQFKEADRNAIMFFSFNYNQDQQIGAASVRPNEYVETVNEKLRRIIKGDRKNLALLPPITTGQYSTYYLAEPSGRTNLTASDIVAYAKVEFDADDRNLRVTELVGPPALGALLLDAIKFDADDNGIYDVIDETVDPNKVVRSPGLRGFTVAHGTDPNKMIARGNAILESIKKKHLSAYPGTWASHYFAEGLKQGTPEQPVRLNRGKPSRKKR